LGSDTQELIFVIRSKILSAATALVLALGISVSGTSAAVAATPYIDPSHGAGTTCNSIGFTKPAELDNINGGTGSATYAWGTISWSGNNVSWTINAGWSVDICVKGGNVGPSQFSGQTAGDSYTHSHGVSHLGYRATFTAPVASASISSVPRDCENPTSWNVSGATITNATWGTPTVSAGSLVIVATATGGALFPTGEGVSVDRTTKTFSVAYVEAGGENCAPLVAAAAVTVDPRDCYVGTALVINPQASENVSWGEPVVNEQAGTITIVATATGGALFEQGLSGVSEDRTQRTFTEPYEPAGGDDCVAPSIDVTAASTPLTCDPDSGSFTVGLVDPSDPNADKLLWTTTAGTVPSASANTVSNPGVVTVTVRIADAHLGDFALNEASSLGVVSMVVVDGVETALITWTFTFVEADGCELGAIVVPIVTHTDYCEGAGPNALRVASFTVTDVVDASYSYTVNGGSPIAIDFAGADTVTIAVSPQDVVVVTATPADGFDLPLAYTPYTHTFLGAAFCPGTFPATVASAVMEMPHCDGGAGSLTLTNEAGVIWTVNDEVVPGNSSHSMPAGTSIVLQAHLEEATLENPGGWTWSDPDQQTEWVQTFSMPDDCSELSFNELALTGSRDLTTWFGAAAIVLMLAGIGFVVRRHRVEV